MKITLISTLEAYWGGSEVLWIKCAELAKAEGHQLQVVVYDQPTGFHPSIQMVRQIADSFVNLPNIQVKSAFDKVMRSVRYKLWPPSLSEVYKFAPDVILLNQQTTYSAPLHPLMYPLLKNFGKAFYLISHFNSDHMVLAYDDMLKAKEIFPKAKKIFFVSRRNKDMAEKQLAMLIPNSKVIDNHPYAGELKLIPYPGTNLVYNFASVARLEANIKGQDILLQVISTPKWKERNWHLNFYGTGPDEQYLKELADFYGLKNRVSFHGHVANIMDVWKVNHALLMPSVAEGKPLSIIEAMLCGRTAIVSDVAGNAELIDDCIDGFLASSYFSKPFDEAMERAWAVKQDWQNMGLKAHEKMINCMDFNPHKTIFETIMQG